MTDISFEALPLAAPIHRALAEKGYETPSPIQARAIPVILEGRDLLACAQTGTGKTAAFALPVLHRISELRRRPGRGEIRCLVLTPTRELAVQVADSFKAYGKFMKTRVGLMHGGVSQNPQVRASLQGLDVLVATPGRLIDLFDQGFVDLSQVGCFILDEADRMLDMGFINDIRRIAAEIPRDRHTLFFSATMAPEITQLASTLLNNPEEIRIAPEVTTAEKIEQRIHFVQRENKESLLFDLLAKRRDENRGELSLVFSRTKHGARKLSEKLNRAGFRSDAIHGDKSQAQRQKTLDRFRDGRTPVLVATDVAARGIDVRNITLVVNFDMPLEADSYVHRIGRTARAGASGCAISFCSRDEVQLLQSVERLIKQSVPVDEDHGHHSEAIAEQHRSGGRGSRGGQGSRGFRGRAPRKGPARGGFRSRNGSSSDDRAPAFGSDRPRRQGGRGFRKATPAGRARFGGRNSRG